MGWEKLGEGNFNRVYVDREKGLVLKVQKQDELEGSDLKLDIPERSVRLWNEINFNIEPKAAVVEFEVKDQYGNPKKVLGWTAPFIDASCQTLRILDKPSDVHIDSVRNATMDEVSKALVDIYNHTGRVVLDACVPSNFKTITFSDKSEKTICIDIGMSLKLQRMEPSNESFTSLEVWADTAKPSYIPWFKGLEGQVKYKDVVKLVEALFTLQIEYPYITNADFLKEPKNEKLRDELASALKTPSTFKMDNELKQAYEEYNATHSSINNKSNLESQ